MSLIFSSRPTGYKLGVCLLFFAFVLFVMGFAVPHWSRAEFFVHRGNLYGDVDFHEGLWMFCTMGRRPDDVAVNGCASLGVTGFATWFHVVRAFECLCLVGLLGACGYALYANYSGSMAGVFTRILEFLAAFSGVLGFIGCTVYMAKVNDRTEKQQRNALGTDFFVMKKDFTLAWDFYWAAVGTSVSLIAAIVIAIFNKPLNGPDSTARPFRYLEGSVCLTTSVGNTGIQREGFTGTGCPGVCQKSYGYPYPFGQKYSFACPSTLKPEI